MAEFEIVRHVGTARPQIDGLRESAKTEQIDFVERCFAEWTSSENQFNARGEGFWLAITSFGQVVGMVGLNIDPYLKSSRVGRLRHLYVHPSHRDGGLGTELVSTAMRSALYHFKKVRLRTPGERADNFYDNYGFERSSSDTATHELRPAVDMRRKQDRPQLATAIRELGRTPSQPDSNSTASSRALSIYVHQLFLGDALDEHWPAWRGKTTDHCSLQCWETDGQDLVAYFIVGQGFSGLKRFPAKAILGPTDPPTVRILIGNLDGESLAPPEYPTAIILLTDGQPELLTNKASAIEWTEVLSC